MLPCTLAHMTEYTCADMAPSLNLRCQGPGHPYPHARAHTDTVLCTHLFLSTWMVSGNCACFVSGSRRAVQRQPAGDPHKRAWAMTAILRPARLPVGQRPPASAHQCSQPHPRLSVQKRTEERAVPRKLLVVMPHGAPLLGTGPGAPSPQTAKKTGASFRWSSHPQAGALEPAPTGGWAPVLIVPVRYCREGK